MKIKRYYRVQDDLRGFRNSLTTILKMKITRRLRGKACHRIIDILWVNIHDSLWGNVRTTVDTDLREEARVNGAKMSLGWVYVVN